MEQVHDNIIGEHEFHPHVLIVEDEPIVANGLKFVLSQEGYGVDVSMTGSSALDTFRGNGFDLVVTDLRLPDIDGMEVIRKIKDERPETEVVVITAYPTAESEVESARLHVSDYLRKPFTNDVFKKAVDEAVNKKKRALLDVPPARTDQERSIQKREVIRVLDRTYEDQNFWRDLIENGSEALAEYQLSWEARAAILSGDLRWINENVGELTQKQLMFIMKRLEREVW
jgi:DNA-binding NtrC family response regulator